jgi:Ala-tRNA(Pro) deacylase
MPVKKVKDYLEQQGVKYVTIVHSTAFTAQEVAASAHISGREMAKTVMVKMDGRLAMAVVPASLMVDLSALKAATGAGTVELAHETDFRDAFPGCEVGAMPPFGNLYGMDVLVAESLTEDAEIAFNAGTHRELWRIAYADFARLVEPTVLFFSKP